MLDALERPDNAAELHALFSVGDCPIDHALSGTERIGRQHDAAGIEHTQCRGAWIIGGVQQNDFGLVERQVGDRPSRVEAFADRLRDPAAVRLGQRHAAIGQDDKKMRRTAGIERALNRTGQTVAVERHVGLARLSSPAGECHTEAGLAGCDTRQPSVLLCRRARQPQGQRRHDEAACERHRRRAIAQRLRNDGRIWVPKNPDETRSPDQVPEDERDYFLERKYPSYGNLAPRDIASRAAKEACDDGRGVGETGLGVYLDFSDAIKRLSEAKVAEKYGNLFEMYERITGENPTKMPMRIYPASHYTMGGLWVDYELMTTVPGLYCAGEANFSDHGANRLGASALMQGLADGYFVLPYTVGNYLAPLLGTTMPGTDHPEFKAAEAAAVQRFQGYLDIKGTRSPDWFHRELGKIIWDYCGMERTEEGLEKGLSELPALYSEFQKDLRVTGDGTSTNQTLEKAGRVDDFFQLGMLMCRDALERKESCGGHFRSEYQDAEGEAKRDDENFAHVAAWEWTGDPLKAIRNVEELEFESVHLATRSYK